MGIKYPSGKFHREFSLGYYYSQITGVYKGMAEFSFPCDGTMDVSLPAVRRIKTAETASASAGGPVLRERFTVPGYVALKTGCDARRIQHIVVTSPEPRVLAKKTGMATADGYAAAVVMPRAVAALPLPAS